MIFKTFWIKFNISNINWCLHCVSFCLFQNDVQGFRCQDQHQVTNAGIDSPSIRAEELFKHICKTPCSMDWTLALKDIICTIMGKHLRWKVWSTNCFGPINHKKAARKHFDFLRFLGIIPCALNWTLLWLLGTCWHFLYSSSWWLINQINWSSLEWQT